MILFSKHSIKHASISIGAFFCPLALVFLVFLLPCACKEKQSTPDWPTDSSNQSPPSTHHSSSKAPNSTATSPANSPTRPTPPSPSTTPKQEVRFLAYNLRNYLTMRRYKSDGQVTDTSKPEDEITHLIQIIQSANPDILGVCEIGSDSDLKKLQSRLKKSGVDLPHTHRVHGADPVRSLAILSHFPIVSTATPESTGYTLNRRPFQISRSILDATIQLPGKQIRFLGVHLKSKRPSKDADQERMRRSESILLRKHIDQILTQAPDTLLLTYGDFNDSKRAKPLNTVKGRTGSVAHLEMLNLTDSRGESWTHHWKREDIYSRFDYALVNQPLSTYINRPSSRILDPDIWEQASDHRPLLILIR